MSPARTISLVAGAGLLAAWLAAASGARPPAPAITMPPPASDRQLQKVEHLLEETRHLRDAMQGMAMPRAQARNPFEFARPAAPEPDRGPAGRDGTSAPATVPAAAPPPAFTLEGIAQSADRGSAALTAIIGGDGQLFLVKVGDLVTGRYRVAAVSSGEVDLQDLQGGPTLRLQLR